MAVGTSRSQTITLSRQFSRRLTPQDSFLYRSQFLSQDISSTEELIIACNATHDDRVKEVLRAVLEEYLDWFTRYPAANLKSEDIREYTKLGSLTVDGSFMQEFLQRWFRIFCEKLSSTRFGEQDLLAGLEVILHLTDSSVLAAEPNCLLILATALLEKINISETALTAELYPAHGVTLSALYQTLMVFDRAAPGQLDPAAPHGLYQSFKLKLEEIVKHQLYYPICYQAKLIQQCLSRMTHQSAPSDRVRRFICGLSGSLKIVKGIRALVSADFDFGSFMEGYQSLRSAFEGHRIQAKSWYTWTQALNYTVLETIRDPSNFGQFEGCYEILTSKEQALMTPADRRALRFGMIDQLLILVADGPTEHIQQEAAGKLFMIGESCMHAGSWGDDSTIFEAVLNALCAVHLTGINRDSAENALELMQMHPSKHTQEIFSSWLGDATVCQKLSRTRPVLERATSGRVLEMIKGRMGWTDNHAKIDLHRAELKQYYQGDAFALMESFFESESAAHVANLHHQLMLLEELTEGDSNDSRPAPTAKEPIDLKQLFDDRRRGPGQPIQTIDRVLISGNPGTGKTSVSHKICYLWAMEAWGASFQAVYMVPVRSLSKEEYNQATIRQQRTLATAIANNCFDPVGNDDQYIELRDLIQDELLRPTTLVIVDGLDERMSACPYILREVTTRRNSDGYKILYTSRPDGLFADPNFVDIKVECVGLNDDQVVSYIQSEFPIEEDSQKLLSCLRANAVSWYLAHIPVNLLIFCFLWKSPNDRISLQKGNEAGSLLLLYRRITVFMWRRFSERCLVEPVDRDSIFDAIGEVAYKAWSVGDLYIRETILEECISSRSTIRLIKHSGFLFLRSSSLEFVFPHLTFQEYFAGRYLARVLCQRIDGRCIDIHRDFVANNKYCGQFLNLLIFMAEAVVDLEGFEGLEMLYKLLDRDPVEVVCVQHLFLKLKFFNAYLAIHGKPGESQVESTATQCAIQSLKHLIEKSTPPALRNQSIDGQESWVGSVIGYVGRNVTSPGFSRFFDFFFAIRFMMQEELTRLPNIVKHYPEVLTEETEANNLNAVVNTFMRWSSHRNSTFRLTAMGQASRLMQLVPDRAEDIVHCFLRGCSDANKDVRLVGMYYLPNALRLCPQDMKSALVLKLLQTCTEEEDSEVLNKARSEIRRVLEIAPEHSSMMTEVLHLARDDDAGGAFGFHSFEKLTVEKLLDTYWENKDDKKIQAVVCKLFNVALTVQSGSNDQMLKLVLHTSSNQSFEWEKPKAEIRRFVSKVDDNMYAEIDFLPERLRHNSQSNYGYVKKSLLAMGTDFLVRNVPSI